MLLATRQLFKLSVYTRSGVLVGKLVGFEFEAESQTVLRYEVRRSLFGPPLLIHRDQVISITNEKMIVADAAVPAESRSSLAVRGSAPESTTPIQSVIKEKKQSV